MKFTLLPPDTDVDGLITMFAESMLTTAVNFAPRAKHSQRRAGRYASEKTKAEMMVAWQKGKAVRELLHTDLGNINLRESLKSVGKRV
ncbi:MAG: hypothetical protein ABJ056_02780 [Halioglobus sp.]